MSSRKSWVKAARLRTLPLALSSIILGGALAAFEFHARWDILALSLVTALFLQILSNFANDYGDSEKGTDNQHRVGPKRTIQSGEITPAQMRRAMVVMALLALASGLTLVFVGTMGIAIWGIALFIVLGLCCIAAAVKYTVGEKAYGYRGLGDLFVFIFFGLTGVVGTYFLSTQQVFLGAWLLGSSVGLFSVGVLNLNNMRDIANDRNSGKLTLPVRMGFKKAKIYHICLIGGGLLFALVHTIAYYQCCWMLLPYLSIVLFIRDLKEIILVKDPVLLDPYLKKLSLSTLAFVLLYSAGLYLSMI
ncbi:1,4-dihydroxy-2-naphthoate octaprenyltransferase [uncultured Acetobacteroides sp.]|uniref:1,4-dihydroxy-2-naphthoate octaprenyltransferase n=1 Tax=uncultured Acetobacteroides sp. TaxID=1760811 RepID=UPI0029F56CF8|nr:1,4-dihydroxy-2-naphthoate octaprenyltransferase [uncultured Acetobacteroides sp.]